MCEASGWRSRSQIRPAAGALATRGKRPPFGSRSATPTVGGRTPESVARRPALTAPPSTPTGRLSAPVPAHSFTPPLEAPRRPDTRSDGPRRDPFRRSGRDPERGIGAENCRIGRVRFMAADFPEHAPLRFTKDTMIEAMVATDQVVKAHRTGLALILMTEACGYTAPEAWRIMNPQSLASAKSARASVARWKRNHRRRYPLSVYEAMATRRITKSSLLEEMMTAMTAPDETVRERRMRLWKRSSGCGTGFRIDAELSDRSRLNRTVEPIRHSGPAEAARQRPDRDRPCSL